MNAELFGRKFSADTAARYVVRTSTCLVLASVMLTCTACRTPSGVASNSPVKPDPAAFPESPSQEIAMASFQKKEAPAGASIEDTYVLAEAVADPTRPLPPAAEKKISHDDGCAIRITDTYETKALDQNTPEHALPVAVVPKTEFVPNLAAKESIPSAAVALGTSLPLPGNSLEEHRTPAPIVEAPSTVTLANFQQNISKQQPTGNIRQVQGFIGEGAPMPCPEQVAPHVPAPIVSLPSQAFTGFPGDGYTLPGPPLEEEVIATGPEAVVPPQEPETVTTPEPKLPPGAYIERPCPRQPMGVMQQWAPPGIRRPWPQDEYLHDGGDRDGNAMVDRDWTLRGVDLEDTIVHYDTLDGRTRVSPSNRVDIYAPRFAAVRKVTGLIQSVQEEMIVGVEDTEELNIERVSLPPLAATKPIEPTGSIGTKRVTVFRDRWAGVPLVANLRAKQFSERLKPHENFEAIRCGKIQEAEKARLAIVTEAALAWNTEQAVQVIVDNKKTLLATNVSKAQQTLMYELAPGKPHVRIIKTASKKQAQPGDIIDFTLRFDNVGDQLVGNVTIIDNLTTRLEYVDGSAQCSIDAGFFTQENEGDSLVLRWEVDQPLKPTQGGIIRFQCRVR